MAFCTFCGKKLEDGEICSCRQPQVATPQPAPQPVPQATPQPVAQENVYAAPQGNPYAAPQPAPQENVYAAPQPAPQENAYAAPQPAPQAAPQAATTGASASGNPFAFIIELAKNTFKKPISAADEFRQSATFIQAVILFGIITLTYTLSVIIHMLPKFIKNTLALKASYYVLWQAYKVTNPGTSYSAYLKMQGINMYVNGCGPFQLISSIFFPILYMALMAGVTIGIAFLINAIFLKRKPFDIKKLIVTIMSVTLPVLVAVLVDFVGDWINISGLRLIFTLVTNAAAVLSILQGLYILNKEIPDRKQFVLTIMITSGALYLFSWLFCLGLTKCYYFYTLPF